MAKYDKDDILSYSLGVFPTFELVKNKAQYCTRLLVHDKLTHTPQINELLALCEAKKIKIETASRKIENLSNKDNTFIVGEFEKYSCALEQNQNHVVLVEPADMGNLGTILRTSLGFCYKNIALIGNCADYFSPKCVRASMGAVFSHNICHFDTFEEYAEKFPRTFYPFMTNGEIELSALFPQSTYSVIFGNESSGLPESYGKIGQSVVIGHNDNIDSLNLSVALSIGLYVLSKRNRQI